jgi:antitoxin component of RelBE/YafQ-DinJ toxin-antitoxin module
MKKQRIVTRLTQEQKDKAQKVAHKKGLSLSGLIALAVYEFLKKHF